ncbi:signal transducer CD24-like [Perognathus longimembris pacificus]|uniref:signal transducer CD24-like n=1 Tax=Perognathus longimembris pacificus TaxID=214514 RepID=UPI002019AD69|nr:signal transducer CD24-like [Perognathus longimembris pacificus]
MGTAMVTRLGLGLLLLALLLPMQIYSNQTVVPFSTNSSQSTTAVLNSTITTTRGGGSVLQSTAGLLVVSLSLLHLYC